MRIWLDMAAILLSPITGLCHKFCIKKWLKMAATRLLVLAPYSNIFRNQNCYKCHVCMKNWTIHLDSSVMVESKMAAITCFTDGSISEVVEGPKLFNCTKIHQFIIQKNTINTTVNGSVSSFVCVVTTNCSTFKLHDNVTVKHHGEITVASFIKLL